MLNRRPLFAKGSRRWLSIVSAGMLIVVENHYRCYEREKAIHTCIATIKQRPTIVLR